MNDQYLLRERIAEGGMRVVFRAEQVALARLVAAKFLHPELSAVPDLLARFRREAHAASRLSHPNAVAVIDFGVTDGGAPFLVMEYVRGETLAALLRREGPPSLGRALDLVGQILAALDDAHAAGIVHADIKSENVLVVTLADGADLIKVVDFGLARVRGTEEISIDGASLSGTPEYMAPEVIAGADPTTASDLYAVGVILYELLTGATPFAGGSTLEVLGRHLHDVVVPPSLRAPEREIPIAVERACLCALEKRPDARFADAGVFARALEDAMPIPDAHPCPRCGGPRPDGSRFCPDCGASAIPEPIPSEAPTRPIDVSPAPEIAIELQRTAIATAIARGDPDEIAAGYLVLARVLTSRHREAAAIAELEEAIDLVTAGDGAGTHTPPRSLWRLLIALARLHERTGDHERADRLAADAVRHAHA